MPQRANLAARDVDRVHMEKLDLPDGSAVQLFDDLGRVRPLDLVAVMLANHSLSARNRGRAVIGFGREVVAAGLRLELKPIRGGGAADEFELVFLQVKENAIAYDKAVVAAGDELLGAVDGKLREAVDREMGEHLQSVRTLDINFHHMVGLVEKDASFASGALLIAPIGVFGGNHRINIRS